MRNFNLVVAKDYTDQYGNEKTSWKQVGRMVHFPATEDKKEGFIIELNMFPNLKIQAFPFEKREESQVQPQVQPQAQSQIQQGVPMVNEQGNLVDSISPDDIPF